MGSNSRTQKISWVTARSNEALNPRPASTAIRSVVTIHKHWCQLAILVALLVIVVTNAFAENQEKAQKKALEQQAKALIQQAQSLKSAGKLREARVRFAQAQSFWESKKSAEGIKDIDEAIHKLTQSALKKAHKLFVEGKFKDAATTLESTADLAPMTSNIAFDIALCYLRLGETAVAAGYLDQAAAAATAPKRRLQLAQWRTAVVTGEQPSAESKGKGREQLETLNGLLSELGEASEELLDDPNHPKTSSDPVNTAASTPSPGKSETADVTYFDLSNGKVCRSIESASRTFTALPSVIFDLANCAQNNNAPARAAELLDSYLRLAPKAVDSARVRIRIEELRAIAELPDPSGTQVRALLASASTFTQMRKYHSALAKLEEAAALAPEFAPTQWKLALLHEDLGNTKEARECFSTFLRLKSSPEAQHEAKLHLETLDVKRENYDVKVAAARLVLSNLLNRSMNLTFNGLDDRSALFKRAAKAKKEAYDKNAKWVGGFLIPSAYAQQQLSEAAAYLAQALALVPLGREANQLMGFVMLQANDGNSAMKPFDVVASFKLPVAFYAELRGRKQHRAVKCELTGEGIQLMNLASYGKNSKPAPPEKSAGLDGLGDLVLDSQPNRDRQVDSWTVMPSEIKRVETKNGHLVLKLANEEVTLSPVFLASRPSTEGPAARRFANAYTRLFIRYVGLEDSKLGAEGLTVFEKVKLGYRLTTSGFNLAMSLNPVGAAYAAQALYEITREIRDVTKSLRVSYASWTSTVQDQEIAHTGEPFKMIPIEQPNWAFLENIN